MAGWAPTWWRTRHDRSKASRSRTLPIPETETFPTQSRQRRCARRNRARIFALPPQGSKPYTYKRTWRSHGSRVRACSAYTYRTIPLCTHYTVRPGPRVGTQPTNVDSEDRIIGFLLRCDPSAVELLNRAHIAPVSPFGRPRLRTTRRGRRDGIPSQHEDAQPPDESDVPRGQNRGAAAALGTRADSSAPSNNPFLNRTFQRRAKTTHYSLSRGIHIAQLFSSVRYSRYKKDTEQAKVDNTLYVITYVLFQLPVASATTDPTTSHETHI